MKTPITMIRHSDGSEFYAYTPSAVNDLVANGVAYRKPEPAPRVRKAKTETVTEPTEAPVSE